MTPGDRVVAVVPAFDEEATIAATVQALRELGVVEVVVIADGCTDLTGRQASLAGARVLSALHRMGKGGALERAFDLLPVAGVYLLVDGDVGASAREAEKLLDPVMEGRIDLTIGRLPAQPGGGFGLVKGLADRAIRMISGFEANEPLSGQRAARKEVLEACRPFASGFGLETAMTIDAVRLGFRVGEVEVDMTHRQTGRGLGGFAHRAAQGVEILEAVVPRALRLR